MLLFNVSLRASGHPLFLLLAKDDGQRRYESAATSGGQAVHRVCHDTFADAERSSASTAAVHGRASSVQCRGDENASALQLREFGVY